MYVEEYKKGKAESRGKYIFEKIISKYFPNFMKDKRFKPSESQAV